MKKNSNMFEANLNTQIFLTVFIVEVTLIKIFLCTLSACDVKKEAGKVGCNINFCSCGKYV
jgi:hypothetical protein